jgi:hypothetical protein
MKVSQFRDVLQQLASQHDADSRPDDAKGLRILAELFDGPGNQKVVKMLSEIRKVRRLSIGPIAKHD